MKSEKMLKIEGESSILSPYKMPKRKFWIIFHLMELKSSVVAQKLKLEGCSKVRALAVFVLAGSLQSIPVRAQIQNPIQAAKDAYNKAKQQSQQQKQQGQTQNQQSAPMQTASAASNDCCSAEAMQKSAADASFLDIVGIKLGMSPRQVTAAIKAYDPTYKFWVVNARLETPTAASGSFVRVPQYIYAHSPAMVPGQGQVETITVQFTTPPNRPVVQEVQRYVVFHVGEPVLASNLLNNFREKYGQENSGSPGGPTWVYDSSGKLLTQVPNAALNCQPSGNISANITPADPNHDAGTINLSSTVTDTLGNILSSACVPYVYAKAWGTGTTPNEQITAMTVSIRSGALAYNSTKATHNWLQADADAKAKQQQDAAGQRTGPKL